ncbi:UNVERIFIED_CONTAM: hypothetical protein K2H54_044703 [Gekko kuhli]
MSCMLCSTGKGTEVVVAKKNLKTIVEGPMIPTGKGNWGLFCGGVWAEAFGGYCCLVTVGIEVTLSHNQLASMVSYGARHAYSAGQVSPVDFKVAAKFDTEQMENVGAETVISIEAKVRCLESW